MPTALWKTWVGNVTPQDYRSPALIDGASGAELTFGQLHAAAQNLADALGPRLAGGGRKIVAFAERNGFRWLIVFLALQREGAVALPLDAALPEAQRVSVASTLGAHFLLRADNALQPLPTPVERFVDEAALDAETESEICLLKLTSGTTGQPKPLPCTSANMLADGRQVCATMDIGPNDLNLGAIPFGHSYGLGNLVLPLILRGTPIVCSQEMLPAALAAQIARFGVTVFPTVPVVLRALAESEVDAAQARTLRRVISAGAVLRPEVAAAFERRFRQRAHNFYGSSETGGICFDRSGEATLSGRALGTPLEGVEVRLNAEGRVVVRSAAVVGSGMEHVLPDLGEWNACGELRLIGRAATAVANIGGKKVDPAEVERALRALAGVTDAWVAVRPRAAGEGDFLFAAVETAVEREEILRGLAARLPAWQIPRRIFTAAQLPRNERGKLDRAALEAESSV